MKKRILRSTLRQNSIASSKLADDEKSELLKDILGFANAWRRATAYILIGVKEVRGGRSNVVGIPATSICMTIRFSSS
jgi:predicted HTH transcriptional regulator